MADLKAQIAITADASGVEAGVGRAKRSLADLGITAQSAGAQAAAGVNGIGAGASQSASRVESATKNMIGSIQRTTAALDAGSRTSSAYFQTLASQRGINADVLKPYLDQLDQVAAKQKIAAEAAKATAAATAGLHATGLVEAGEAMEAFSFKTAAAKRELLVLGHELATGNYKRFSTSLLVLGERTGAASLLFSKAALAAGGTIAAIALLAIAMEKGANETFEYAKALTLTGNVLGLTTDELQDLAKQISGTIGTQHEAAAALAALATSGKIGATALRDVGEAVVSMNRVLGTSVEQATAVFVKLSKEPAKASAELNEQMHYLTQSTYDRIAALESQGEHEEAAALAQKTYADATNDRLKSVAAQLGWVQKGWHAVWDEAHKAWDEMDGIGRPKTIFEQLQGAQDQLAADKGAQEHGIFGKSIYGKYVARDQSDIADLSQRMMRETENAAAEGQKRQAEDAKIAASSRLADMTKATRSRHQQRQDEIDQLNRDAKTIGLSEAEYERNATTGARQKTKYAALRDAIDEKYKDKAPKHAKAYTDDAATRMLETLRQTQASLGAQLAGEDKLTEAQKEQAKFQQLIADLKGKTILTADQKSLLAANSAIDAQLAINVALDQQIQKKQAAVELDKKSAAFQREMDALTRGLQTKESGRDEQYSASLAAVGLGDEANQRQSAQRSLYKDRDNALREARNRASTAADPKSGFDPLQSKAYQDGVVKINASLQEALSSQKAYFDALQAVQADWKNGASKALANYVDEANDAAKRAQSLVTQSLGGITDGITSLLMGDKGSSFEKVGKSIATSITKGIVEQQITKPIAQWLQGDLGNPDSMIGKLLGGVTGTSGTGESWLGGLLGGKSSIGDATGAASTATMATSAAAATTALAALTDAAAAAAVAMGGSAASADITGALSAANSVGASGGDALGSLISSMGWAEGGYTGDGGKYEPAGIVHAGEYVVNADSTAKLGTGFLDRLNRKGYADGGFVGAIMTRNLGQSASMQGAGRVVNLTMNVPKGTDTKTAGQWGAAAARQLRMSDRRNN